LLAGKHLIALASQEDHEAFSASYSRARPGNESEGIKIHWNGSGYPAGLAGEAIIPEARILAVADLVEARLSPRGDSAPVGIERALAEIYQGAGTLYDPSVVEACLKVFVAKGFTSPEAAGPG
jgi:hypothetical protein